MKGDRGPLLITSGSLAVRLGARYPTSVEQHQAVRAGYYGPYMMVRDEDGLPLFWPLQVTVSSCQ